MIRTWVGGFHYSRTLPSIQFLLDQPFVFEHGKQEASEGFLLGSVEALAHPINRVMQLPRRRRILRHLPGKRRGRGIEQPPRSLVAPEATVRVDCSV